MLLMFARIKLRVTRPTSFIRSEKQPADFADPQMPEVHPPVLRLKAQQVHHPALVAPVAVSWIPNSDGENM